MLKRIILAAVFIVLPLNSLGTAEYQLKAAYLYNIIKFVKWNNDEMRFADEHITICIIGKDPFKENLDPIKKKSVKGRTLKVKNLSKDELPDDCDVMFISKSEEDDFENILKKIKGKSILTVSDIDNFAENDGMIGFVMKDNKIKLHININSAENESIVISSRLIELSEMVGR